MSNFLTHIFTISWNIVLHWMLQELIDYCSTLFQVMAWWHYPYIRVNRAKHWPDSELSYPDSKVHATNMGPIWGQQDPDGPHVGPMNLANWGHSISISHPPGEAKRSPNFEATVHSLDVYPCCWPFFSWFSFCFYSILHSSYSNNIVQQTMMLISLFASLPNYWFHNTNCQQISGMQLTRKLNPSLYFSLLQVQYGHKSFVCFFNHKVCYSVEYFGLAKMMAFCRWHFEMHLL